MVHKRISLKTPKTPFSTYLLFTYKSNDVLIQKKKNAVILLR